MPMYEGSALTTIVTASVDAVLGAFHAGAKPAHIREIHLFSVTAATTSLQVGLKRSTAVGTGGLTSNLGVPWDPRDNPGASSVATAWASTAPTVAAAPAGILRGFAGAAAIGTGIVWTWESPGLFVPASNDGTAAFAAASELCLVNQVATAPGTMRMVVIWSE